MREQIIEILEEINEDITKDMEVDLIASGILDSFDIASIITEIEDAFDVEIDVELVVMENFKTANTIIEFFTKVIEG